MGTSNDPNEKKGAVILNLADFSSPTGFSLSKENNKYKSIIISSEISPESYFKDIKSLMPENDYQYITYLDCSDASEKAFPNVFAYEVQLPGKIKVWFAYWYETGNGFGHFGLSIYFNQEDAPKTCVDIQ